MPNLKIFTTIVFIVACLVIGLEYLPKFYTQSIAIETIVPLESNQTVEEKMLQVKEETKRTHIGYAIIGYCLLLSLLVYLKILIQRHQKIE